MLTKPCNPYIPFIAFHSAPGFIRDTNSNNHFSIEQACVFDPSYTLTCDVRHCDTMCIDCFVVLSISWWFIKS